jgi:hypothetical protein
MQCLHSFIQGLLSRVCFLVCRSAEKEASDKEGRDEVLSERRDATLEIR